MIVSWYMVDTVSRITAAFPRNADSASNSEFMYMYHVPVSELIDVESSRVQSVLMGALDVWY